MDKEKSRVLIVGQGVAGTLLTFQFIKKNYDVTIIDDGHKSSSSVVAAGMWNPLSFKKLNTPWHSKLFLDTAAEVYRDLERLLDVNFFHVKNLLRIFPDQFAANEWDERNDLNDVKYFASPKITPTDRSHFNAPFGMGLVHHAGWCNVPVLLDASRKYFQENAHLITSSFDENALQQIDGKWDYKDSTFDLVILAVGSKNINSKYFNFIPVQPNKGQVLTLSSQDFSRDEIVNYGNFILPIGNNMFRLGATYEFNDPNPHPTLESRNLMLENLALITPKTFDFVDEKAGYRPTMPDRKPVLGPHPLHPNLYIFNGLGSKGVTYAPFFAKQMLDFIEEGAPILKDASIERYYSKYTSVQ